MAEIVLKLPTMVGEIFENYNSQMSEIALKLSIIVEEILEC